MLVDDNEIAQPIFVRELAQCDELGVLVVGFLPLLYCDVSDSWLQQDRRKRILVSAAGIGTELLLAAVFAMLWTISRQGFLHTFSLYFMTERQEVCLLLYLVINKLLEYCLAFGFGAEDLLD